MTRRDFLALPLALALAPLARVHAAREERSAAFAVDVGVLYDMMTFHLAGTIDESVDRDGGRYEVRISGRGTGISNRVDSNGILRAGRWAPLRTRSVFLVRGRETRSDVAYDHDRRIIDYKSRSETFFLGRVRAVEDAVPIPPGTRVDDVFSATLNYADGLWPPESDGTFRTHVIRRRRGPREGPDDVEKTYHGELVPFVLKVAPDPETGKPTALFDLTRFSSWARESQPARIVFGPDRRPEAITSTLILGTSINIKIAAT